MACRSRSRYRSRPFVEMLPKIAIGDIGNLTRRFTGTSYESDDTHNPEVLGIVTEVNNEDISSDLGYR
jgi:hypothetical protein